LNPFVNTPRGVARLIISAFALATVVVLPSTASAEQRTATPATLDSVFAVAGPGDTIALAGGDYGTFRGGNKPGNVKLKPQAGAVVTMRLDFGNASKITIDGLTLTNVEILEGSRNITVRNSDIPGQVVLRDLANANVLFEHNVHRDWDKCNGCGEGRIFVTGGRNQPPSGVTIRRSEFRGGVSDGIQNGAKGTRIIGNVFHDLGQGTQNGVHTDAIQLYGSSNTVIRGNHFYNVPDAIMSPDGADHELIEDNVIAGDRGGYPYALTLWSDTGSIVRHNTFADGDCMFNLPCGILSIGSKSGEPAGRGTIVTDNILSDISVADGDATLAKRSHNLLAHGRPSAPGELRGNPTYVGGASPLLYAGYALKRGTLGKGSASDGLDRGARIGDGPCQKAMKQLSQATKKLKRAKKKLRKKGGRKARTKVKKSKAQKRRAKQKVRALC
jgi:Right handed beta helix region